MKISQSLCLLCLYFSLSFSSCKETTQIPQVVPGDPDYVPPEWVQPELAYERAAYTPASIYDYRQAPGQFAGEGAYNIPANAEKALGFPNGGGTNSPNNDGVVSLGMAGGYITFKFEPPIENHPDNIGGYDFIVFGNAYWTGAGLNNTWKEPGVVYIMKDKNGDGVANDTWYLIPGSELTQASQKETISYHLTDPALPPVETQKTAWWPLGEASDSIIFDNVLLLSDSLYTNSVSCFGYADTTPALLLGDLTGALRDTIYNNLDNAEDYPGIDPVYFYTVPDNPDTDGIDAGSGGGDAIDITWAVKPDTFETANLDQISWIRIVSATLTTGVLGDFSCEIDAVTRVRRN